MSKIIQRPLSDQPTNVPDGLYKGIIENAAIVEFDDTIRGGKRDTLVINVSVRYNGNLVYMNFYANVLWLPTSLFHKALVALGAMPERGQDVDLSCLVNKPVTVPVKNEARNGVSYCNVKEIRPAESLMVPVATEAAVAPTTNTAECEVDDDDDDELIYDD